MQQQKVAFLAWMYNEQGARPAGAWVNSLLSLAARSQEFGLNIRPRACETGPQLDKARNMLLQAFLRTEDDYLLFSDTDVLFEPGDVRALLEADAPIAGALYFTAATGGSPTPVPLVGEPGDDGETRYVPMLLPEPPEDLLPTFEPNPDDPDSVAEAAERDQAMAAWAVAAAQPTPVAGVGMGLTLIKREVAAEMAEAHPRPFEYANGLSEDLTFCLRAADLGFQTVCVLKARAGHVKATIL
jgi:hypothetical protein